MMNPDSDKLLERQEVEARFGISKRFLEVSAMKKSGPRMVKIGRLVRYRVKDIETWIDQNTTGGEQ